MVFPQRPTRPCACRSDLSSANSLISAICKCANLWRYGRSTSSALRSFFVSDSIFASQDWQQEVSSTAPIPNFLLTWASTIWISSFCRCSWANMWVNLGMLKSLWIQLRAFKDIISDLLASPASFNMGISYPIITRIIKFPSQPRLHFGTPPRCDPPVVQDQRGTPHMECNV